MTDVQIPTPAMTLERRLAPVPPAPVLPADKPKSYKLLEGDIAEAEYKRRVFVVWPAKDVPFEALLEPAYWANTARKFGVGDRIEVYPVGGDYFAELIVRDFGNLWAKVAVLRKHVFDADLAEPSADYMTKWVSPGARYGVVRIKDNAMIQSGFGTKADALAWIAANIKSLSS